MEPKPNLSQFSIFGNSLADEYIELVSAFKDLQSDYEKTGFRNDTVYARSCHALDNADKSMKRMQEIIKGGEAIDDFQKNLGHNN
jgi:hypothetical protein